MQGLRSAGSAFRNPPGDYAGRLIEAAGCKGDALGGARVSPQHANVLIAESGCTSSDLVALAGMVRESVHRRLGVTLELEIEIPGCP